MQSNQSHLPPAPNLASGYYQINKIFPSFCMRLTVSLHKKKKPNSASLLIIPYLCPLCYYQCIILHLLVRISYICFSTGFPATPLSRSEFSAVLLERFQFATPSFKLRSYTGLHPVVPKIKMALISSLHKHH